MVGRRASDFLSIFPYQLQVQELFSAALQQRHATFVYIFLERDIQD